MPKGNAGMRAFLPMQGNFDENEKPDVDYIMHMPCNRHRAESKITSNARSTVGSMTEIYDFLIIICPCWKTISPISDYRSKKHETGDVIDYLKNWMLARKYICSFPVPTKYDDRTLSQELSILLQKGYTPVMRKHELFQIEDVKAKGWPLKISYPSLKQT